MHRKPTALCRLFCALLTAALVTAPVSAARYPDKVHLPVDYADMVFTGYDDTSLLAALEDLESLDRSGALRRENREIRQRIQALYHTILEELNQLSTQCALIGIQYDASGGAAEAARASAELSDRSTRLFDRCRQSLSCLSGTPYGDILEPDIGREGVKALGSYQPLTEELAELYQEEERLIQEYDQVMARPAQVTVDGTTWTEERLDAASDLDDRTYWNLLTQLERAQNQAAGAVFLQLLSVRNQIAQETGFENYAAYAYTSVYSRDYAAEDIQAVWEAVKETFVPLSQQMAESLDSRGLRDLDLRSRASGQELVDRLRPLMEDLHPELGESFAFLQEHRLYDIDASDRKLPVGYTVALPAYGSAFIFNCPYGGYQDYSDLIHEFGHFHETFRSAQHELWADFNIDVGEIHSQGLELLFTAYSDQLFGSYGETYTAVVLYNILDSVLEGCLYDEFQTAVYQDPDMTLEEINCLFKDLSEDYGYTYGPGEQESYFWVQVSHNFQSPLYYISYAVSALSALDLWLWSLSDREAAVETYLDLTALSLSLPYREAIRQAGLADIFQPDTLEALAKGLEDFLEDRPVSYPPSARSLRTVLQQAGPAVFAWKILIFPGAAGLLLAGLLLLRAQKKRRGAVEPCLAPEKKPPWEL